MKDIFDRSVCDEVIARINRLTPDTRPQWGTMDVARMLAHCNVTYEMLYEDKHPKPGPLARLLLKAFVKGPVVSAKPYARNSRTAPAFIVRTDKDFAAERSRLIAYIDRTQALGGAAFEGRVSRSFGPLTQKQWNNLFYKHLEHHLTQFGV